MFNLETKIYENNENCLLKNSLVLLPVAMRAQDTRGIDMPMIPLIKSLVFFKRVHQSFLETVEISVFFSLQQEFKNCKTNCF